MSTNGAGNSGSLVPRPPKRQKTGGPVVTRYAPPPGYQAPQPQRGYTYPQAGQHQPLTSPSTFNSQNQPWSGWQGVHQPTYQPPNLPPQPTPPGPWNSQSSPVSGSPYHAQFSSPVSANGASHQQNYFPNPTSQQAPPPGYTSGPHGTPIPQSQPITPEGRMSATPQHDSTVPNQEEDLIEKILAKEPEMEPWLEELKALDDAYLPKPGSGPTSKCRPYSSSCLGLNSCSLSSTKSSSPTTCIYHGACRCYWTSTNCSISPTRCSCIVVLSRFIRRGFGDERSRIGRVVCSEG